ncbi:MAG: PAS domain S-box protein [Candidatus Hodarchaeales archaeon]
MLRVLIVDDDESFLYFAELLLARETSRFNVVTATSAKEALFILDSSQEAFDAIVSDYQMPGMNGLEFLENLRSQGNDIPFIMFTGKGREEIAIDALNLRADHYLKKEGAPENLYGELAYTIKRLVEHRRTQQALQEAQARAQKYLDVAGVILLALARDGTVTLINRKGCTVLGYPEEEIVGMNWFETFLPERMQEEVRTVFADLMEGSIEPVEYFENPVTAKNGAERIIAWHNTVLIEDGRTVGTLSSGEDITERKQAEEALRESEERFRMIFQESNDGLALVEITEEGHLGPFLEVNDAFCQLSGFKRLELNTLVPRDLVPPEEYERLKRDGIIGKWQRDDIAKFEASFFIRDGTTRLAEVSAPKITLDEKQFRLLMVHDITARKQAEAALQTSEQRYRSVVEQSIQGLGILQDGKFVFANSALAEMYGGPIDELLALSPEEAWGRVHPEDRERILKSYQNRLEGEPVPTRTEYRVFDKDGRIRWVLSEGTFTHFQGRPAIQSVYFDITERKRAEEALKESEAQLKRQKEELSEFAHAMNHDIRNHLVAVKGYAGYLQSEPEPKYAERISKLVDQIDELLQRSVTLADAGLIAEATCEINLNRLVKDIAEVCVPKTTAFIQDDLPVVTGDYEKLLQVFKNLFENAVTHGKAKKIIVRQNGSESGINIDITNDGDQIPAKYHSQLFRRGFTTNKGGGLGLPIVQKIIKAHGWQLSFESIPQTTFRITIPA